MAKKTLDYENLMQEGPMSLIESWQQYLRDPLSATAVALGLTPETFVGSNILETIAREPQESIYALAGPPPIRDKRGRIIGYGQAPEKRFTPPLEGGFAQAAALAGEVLAPGPGEVLTAGKAMITGAPAVASMAMEAFEQIRRATKSPKVRALVEEAMFDPSRIIDVIEELPAEARKLVESALEKGQKVAGAQWFEPAARGVPAHEKLFYDPALVKQYPETLPHEPWHILWSAPAKKGGFSASARRKWIDVVGEAGEHPNVAEQYQRFSKAKRAEETLTHIEAEIAMGGPVHATERHIKALEELTGETGLLEAVEDRLVRGPSPAVVPPSRQKVGKLPYGAKSIKELYKFDEAVAIEHIMDTHGVSEREAVDILADLLKK